MAEIRKFINSDLQGKDLVVNFFQKKFERLKFLSQDPYNVINDNFVENRGSERFQARLNIAKAAALAYIISKKNSSDACKMIEGVIQRHNGEWSAKVEEWIKGAMESF
jgi:hypothetical protein